MESIVVAALAEALCFHPQTLARLIHGRSTPKSKLQESVSLLDIAPALQADVTTLSSFLIAQAKGEDEAIDLEMAGMILDRSERQLRRDIKEGIIPVLVHTRNAMRFSREAIVAITKPN